MKNTMKTAKPNKLNNLLTLNQSMYNVLSLNDMKNVKGGDGEDNGGVDIIIIPKPK